MLYSCSETPKTTEEPGQSDPIEILYSFDTLVLDKEWGDCAESEDGCITISFSYPQIHEPDSIGSIINLKILRLLRIQNQDSVTDAEAYSESLIDEFKKAQLVDNGAGTQIENEIALEYASNQLISIRQFSLEISGGAHPNARLTLRSYSTETGQRVYLNNVFKTGFSDSLTKLARFYLENAINSSMEIEYAAGSKTGSSAGFELSENFNLNENGISFFHLDPIVQSDGYGFIEFTIPYTELIKSDLIDENGVLGFLLGSVNL